MTDTHNYSFFGQKTGMIVQSSSKSEPYIFIKLLKKNNNGAWEKLSNGEGKTIKFSLEELILIRQVLTQDTKSWSGYHKFKGKSTQISFNWQQNNEKKTQEILWIRIDDYSKMLNYAQTEILKLLLTHIIQEKIEFATTTELPQVINDHNIITHNKRDLYIEEEIETNDYFGSEQSLPTKVQINTKTDTITLFGIIKGESKKALLIAFENGVEFWVPKSVIHSPFEQKKETKQSFIIDKWILEKNKVII